MDKNLKKFRENYLNELTSDDITKREIMNKLDLKTSTKPVKKTLNNKVKMPLIFGGSSLGLITVLTIMIVVGIFAIINYRNTPVYKGMDADNATGVVSKLSGVYNPILFDDDSINNNGNGNDNGHENTGNQGNGHKHNFKDQIDEIGPQIGIVVDDRIVCYANPGEEIIITVQIDNPKSFEILSFTLNGYLYQTYEFMEGSNSTQIKVKFTCQETSGIQVVTIDAIKYIDGTTIKDARFGGEKTINVGVTYQNVPQAVNVNEVGNLTNHLITFDIIDTDKLINVTSGLKLYLFDTESLVQVVDLTLGKNVVPLTDLHLGSEYAYAIVGVFDLYDGEGKKSSILHQNEFRTQEGYEYGVPELTYDSAKVNYIKSEGFDGVIEKVSLYLNDELIKEVTPTSIDDVMFDGLLSNNEYKVVTSYKYKIFEESVEVEITKNIETTFTTLERPTPVVESKEKEITKTSISFDYEITDTTNLGKVIKVEVYNNDVLVSSFDEDKREFTDLLSDNDYKFVTTYEYDLLDGQGARTLQVESVYHTVAKVAPTAVFSQPPFGMNSILYAWVEVNDVDGLIKILSIDLYKDGALIQSATEFANYNEDSTTPGKFSGDLTFTGLEKGDYTLVVKYQYDLNDGSGIHLIDENHPTADNKIGAKVA